MKLRTIIFLNIILLVSSLAESKNIAGAIGRRLDDVVGRDNIGVAVITSQGDTVAVHGKRQYPLMSVMKFHQAVALSHKLGFPAILTDSVLVVPSDLPAGTWSPMRARNSEGGIISLPTLLSYSLLLSDNNACDIIFDRYITPAETDSIIRRISSSRNFAIAYSEAEMNADPPLCRANYSTPLDCVSLFDHVFNADTTAAISVVKAILSEGTRTGTNRLPAAIPEGKGIIYHKTGTGYGAVNDAGVVCYPLPDGGYATYSIAVFTDGLENTEEAEKRIAEISAIVWEEHVIHGLTAAADRVILPTYTPHQVPVPEKPGFGASVLGAFMDAAVEAAVDATIDGIWDSTFGQVVR